jgi:putative glycosyltransferase (TIGR04348 family)
VKIALITPAPAGSLKGNRVTALRWARILRALGHRVRVQQAYDGRDCDLLVALHARRSADSIAQFRRAQPSSPLVVALTGTDLYGDIQTDPAAQRSLELASHLIVLQPEGINELPRRHRSKARVILPSASKPSVPLRPLQRVFEVCVLSHLRPVKDPLRAALAARLLPSSSRIRVVHAGAALTEEAAAQARAEATANPRYRWLGEQPRWKALRLLARGRVLVVSSKMEGGANVVSEAIAASVPILASRIPGLIGRLGSDYPGYFPVGDAPALANLMRRAEIDVDFLRSLKAWCRRLTPSICPTAERKRWADLLQSLLL